MSTSVYQPDQFVVIAEQYKYYIKDQANSIFRIFGMRRTNTDRMIFIQNLDTMCIYRVPDYFIEPVYSTSTLCVPEDLL